MTQKHNIYTFMSRNYYFCTYFWLKKVPTLIESATDVYLDIHFLDIKGFSLWSLCLHFHLNTYKLIINKKMSNSLHLYLLSFKPSILIFPDAQKSPWQSKPEYLRGRWYHQWWRGPNTQRVHPTRTLLQEPRLIWWSVWLEWGRRESCETQTTGWWLKHGMWLFGDLQR